MGISEFEIQSFKRSASSNVVEKKLSWILEVHTTILLRDLDKYTTDG